MRLIVTATDLVGSFVLVAVRVAEVADAIAAAGALYVTPVGVMEESVPGPLVMLQLTPELEGSLTTVSVNACEPPAASVAVPGLMGFRVMAGATLMTAEPVLLGSALLVAVKMTVDAEDGFGAV